MLLEVFAGRPREWSLTSAVNKLIAKLQLRAIAIGLDNGFDASEDIFNAELARDIDTVINASAVRILWLAVPCESRSLMWATHGAHPFLSRAEPDGRADMPEHWWPYAKRHNALIARSCKLAAQQYRAERTYYVENPVDVGNRASPYYQHSKRHHVPVFISSWFRDLAGETNPHYATTEMCAWLGRFHKPTTIVGAGPGAGSYLYRVNEVKCRTILHILRATDIKPDGTPYSPEAGEYPQVFCAYAGAEWMAEFTGERPPRPKTMVCSSRRVEAFLDTFKVPVERLAAVGVYGAEPTGELSTTLEYWRQQEASYAAQAQELDKPYATSIHIAAEWRSAHANLPAQWDESADVVAARVAEVRAEPLRFVSRRRAEPERPEVLSRRPLPQPSVPVRTEAAPFYKEVPWPEDAPPQPVSADQLWQEGVYQKILDSIAAVQAECLKGEKDAEMRKVKSKVFRPELMQPWARRHVERGGAFDNADPSNVQSLQPYSEEDPVPSTENAVNFPFFKEWGDMIDWVDKDMLHQARVTGVESRSTCTKASIVMGHHGGLRKHYKHAAAAIAKDTAAGFVRTGRAHPWTFPFIAVARNVAERHQWKQVEGILKRVVKYRVTTDDSISVEGEVSRNGGIDPSTWARTGLPVPQTLAEAVAIAKAVCEEMGIKACRATLERIAMWLLDLVGAYRRLLVQRREWGQQQYVWSDGVRLDLRCLFGTSSMVEFFERVTFFVLSVSKRRIEEFDRQHPYSSERQAWCAWRAQHVIAPCEPEATVSSSACAGSWIYLDDAFGLTVLGQHEQLLGRSDSAEKPVQASLHIEPTSQATRAGKAGAMVVLRLFIHKSRPQVHLNMTCATFNDAGWDVEMEKVELGFNINELGFQVSEHGEGCLTIPEAKRLGMIEDIKSQQPEPAGTLREDERVRRDAVEQLVGRCGNIAQAAAEANAYMAPQYRMQHAKESSYKHGALVARYLPSKIDVTNGSAVACDYQRSLSWWRHALESKISIPLAPRLEFPELGSPGVAFMFTDAAREDGTGHGGFTLIRAAGQLIFICVDPRWPSDVIAALQQNRLSMPAGEGIGAVVLADVLAELLPGLSHLIIFTDSTPVVAAMQSGNSDSPQLNFIARWLFQRRPNLQVLALHQPGKRNGAADGLSREASARVRAEAAMLGARVEVVQCEHVMRAMAREAMQFPQR